MSVIRSQPSKFSNHNSHNIERLMKKCLVSLLTEYKFDKRKFNELMAKPILGLKYLLLYSVDKTPDNLIKLERFERDLLLKCCRFEEVCRTSVGIEYSPIKKLIPLRKYSIFTREKTDFFTYKINYYHLKRKYLIF